MKLKKYFNLDEEQPIINELFKDFFKRLGFSNKNEFQKIAIAMLVRDFDSKNNNRDNNALKILEVLKFPKIEFFSDDIVTTDKKMSISGEMNFHGIGIKKLLKQILF